MSSEAPQERRRFRLTVLATVGALVLATVALTFANAVQGPRLIGGVIDSRAAVQRTGQRLVLSVDQTVSDVAGAEVSVTPAVPVDLTWERAALSLRFGATLRYATTYTVLAPVRSVATGAASTLRYSFRTPDAGIYLAQRPGSGVDPGAPAQIVSTDLGSGALAVVHRGQRIRGFAVADPLIAVVEQDQAGVGTLSVAAVDGSGPTRTLASDALISQLKSSGPGGLFGFVLAPLHGPRKDRSQLQVFDPGSGREVIDVVGVDGQPLDPIEWDFVPGTASIIAQTADASIFLLDPVNGAPPQALGAYTRMHGFVGGTPTLILEDPGRYAAIDLVTGTTTRLPALEVPPRATLDRLLPLPGDRGYLGSVVTLTEDDRLHYSVTRMAPEEISPLYASKPSEGIQAVDLSPNGDYLAVETVPREAVRDDDGFAPGTTTVILDSITGRVVAEVPGAQLTW